MLAQQMASLGRAGQVTWLDRSAAALAIAQARAEARGLTNIVWEQRSLLDLPGSGLGPFDYIDCCGVLHHLPDPAEGLRALLSVLAPGGGMGLMVYAPHGRTGVYMMQDALRRLAPPDETAATAAGCRAPGDEAPAGDPMAAPQPQFRRPHQWRRCRPVRPAAEPARPRLHRAGIRRVAARRGAAGHLLGRADALRPGAMLPDPKLRARLDAMDPTERAALAEALAGNMAVHIVYCVRADDPPHRPIRRAETAVPVCREVDGEALARGIRPDGTLPVIFDGLRVPVALPPLASAILPLIDGQRSVGEIGAILAGTRHQAGRLREEPGARPSPRWSGSTACCLPRRPDQ